MIDTDILFIGGLFPKEIELDIYANSKKGIQYAANKLQWNIVNGLDLVMPNKVSIINSMYIGTFPHRYKKLFIKTEKFNLNKNSNNVNVGFINFIGIDRISRYYNMTPYINEWIYKNNSKKLVILYALTSRNINIIKHIKKINPEVLTCIIVPDLPEYMRIGVKTNKIYSIMKELNQNNIYNNTKYVDHFVLITEEMKNKINLNNNYTVIEGMVGYNDDYDNLVEIVNQDEYYKVILYTGGLNEKYGVVDLVESFTQIKDKKYRLIICGSGNLEEYVKQKSKNDDRIIYKGQVEHKQVLKLQKNATVLVNPRKNDNEYTKYSFPSKNLEYLLSGKPVIAYRLDGIPKEYESVICYVNEDNKYGLRDKIIEICEKTNEERDYIGEKGRKFVLERKNNKIQIKRLIRDILGE